MPPERSLSDLFTLTGATAIGLDWPGLFEQAVVDGRGEIVAPDEERVAAADELLTRSLGELLVLGQLAALVSFAPLAEDCRRPLARTSAGLVRLLERALAAHGRDVGYRVEVWRRHIVTTATAAAAVLELDRGEPSPLPTAIRRGADAIAQALASVPRDRLGVPELVAEAAAEFLVVYAAAVAT